jgi:hypothetical protein
VWTSAQKPLRLFILNPVVLSPCGGAFPDPATEGVLMLADPAASAKHQGLATSAALQRSLMALMTRVG